MTAVAPPRPPLLAPPRPGRARTPAGRRRAPGDHPDDLPTLCLTLLTVAVGAGANRMFSGTHALPYLVGAAVFAHGLAWTGRRLRIGATVATLAALLVALLSAIWFVIPERTTFGVPTPSTFRALGDLARSGQTAFSTAVAPAVPSPGFIAGCIVAIVIAAFLADWAAFRMRTAFEASVPALAMFVLVSVLGATHERALATAAFLIATGLFLVVQLAALDGARASWFAGRTTGATRSLVVVGGTLVAAVTLLALVVAPVVPGYGSDAVMSTKHDPSSQSLDRKIASPLVTIHSRLVNLSTQTVFTVRSNVASYWRLTSLDQFNGDVWSISETYSRTRGRLGLSPADGTPTGPTVNASFTIDKLDSVWLAAPYLPEQVSGLDGVSYNPESGSLIPNKDTSDGLTYEIRSVKPDPSAAQLTQASFAVPANMARYLQLPVIPRNVKVLAQNIVAQARTPYERALAIQNYLRTFRYSLTAEQGHGTNVLETFLFQTRAGYCEQFAGSYGVLARLVGLPTRVAVGFREGVKNADGSYTVRDADAHAWPEVWFPGAGWVDFEPTPSRGAPTGEDHTGVAPAPPAPDPGTGTGTGSTVATGAPPTTVPQGEPTTVPADGTTPTTSAASPTNAPARLAHHLPVLGWAVSSTVGALVAVLAILAWVVLVFGLVPAGLVGLVVGLKRHRRNRRRREAIGPEARVTLAWAETQETLAGYGAGRLASETIADYVVRLSRRHGPGASIGLTPQSGALTAMARLASATATSAYAPAAAGSEAAEQAEADRDTVLRATLAAQSRWRRLWTAADPRSLWPARPVRGGRGMGGPAPGAEAATRRA